MTINITPEKFGNVAAEGMRYGFDVSAYIIRRALRQLPSSTATATAAVAEPTPTPATQPELALGYELPPPPPPAGAHGILARAAKLNQTQV